MRREKQSLLGGGRQGVLLTGEFYRRFTEPGAPESLMEWLYTPEHSLACAVNGRVFYDGCGSFLPCAGAGDRISRGRASEENGSPGRPHGPVGAVQLFPVPEAGEYGAAAMALHEFVSAGLSMIFLLNRRYMPYYKWSFRAARELPVLREAAEEGGWLAARSGQRSGSKGSAGLWYRS